MEDILWELYLLLGYTLGPVVATILSIPYVIYLYLVQALETLIKLF